MTLACFKAYDIRGKLGVEINYRVDDVPKTIERILHCFTNQPVRPDPSTPLRTKGDVERSVGVHVSTGSTRTDGIAAAEYPVVDRTDGVSIEFPNWRFNLRGSNTEPLLRRNVEARGNIPAVARHVHQLETSIKETA